MAMVMVMFAVKFDYYNFNWNFLNSNYLFLKKWNLAVDKFVDFVAGLVAAFLDRVSAYPAKEEKLLPREYYLEVGR